MKRVHYERVLYVLPCVVCACVSVCKKESPTQSPPPPLAPNPNPLCIKKMYEKRADVPGLMQMEVDDLVLYPTKRTVINLRLEAEGTDARDEEAVQALMTDAGQLEAYACAGLWRAIHDLQPGEELREVRDFDDFMKTLHSFRVLTKLEAPWESCRATYQCSCEVGQKGGVCKHSLL